MTPFELAEPRTLREASALCAEDASVRAIAGGTALMLMMKAGVFQPARLVSLRGVEHGYSKIAVQNDGSLRIGALATLSTLARSAEVCGAAPVMTQTLKSLANVRVRNVATLGGALAHGDPHMDLPPVLTVLGAQVTTVSTAGDATRAVGDLYTGYYEIALARGELIAEVIVPPQRGWCAAYCKVTTRCADDWPTLGVAVSVKREANVVTDVRLVVSAATDRPVRLAAAEKELRGASLGGARGSAAVLARLARCGEAASSEVELVADTRGSSAYKHELLRVYVGRALREALNGDS